MSALEVGQALVEMVSKGRESEQAFVTQYYSDEIVSIEGGDSAEMPARMEGIEAIRGKHDWWYDNNDVHSTDVEGPYVGNRDDQFVVKFILDMTPTDGERTQMEEVAIFTVKDDKIVHEEYLYRVG
ncbi:MAG: SnoaL-like domain-containing protein [bacterium]|nr:nuclear transport factor 2 family protein [Gammaproteobacteria bacterium]HIL94845.1 nuclear transport factor 2 family protein [Pseudomonadales bacterium]